MHISSNMMRATATTFIPSPSSLVDPIEMPSSSSYKEAMMHALARGHSTKKMMSTSPVCPECACPGPKPTVVSPNEAAAPLGTVAWLPAKTKVPSWSIAHTQDELNDGAFNHPGVPFERSACGHLCRVAPVTSFSSTKFSGDILAKYKNPSEHVLNNQFWEYVAIGGANPSNAFGALEVHKPLNKPSYVHLDGFYWIEARNLGNHNGKASVLTSDALSLVQLACAAAETHRAENNIEPLHKRMSYPHSPRSSSPLHPIPSPPSPLSFSTPTVSYPAPPQLPQLPISFGMPEQAQPFLLAPLNPPHYQPEGYYLPNGLFYIPTPPSTPMFLGGLNSWNTYL